MSSSGLIYAVIVGAWAAYLVPMWLRRQDELNEARPTERFSTAIRLLSGRAAMERRYAKDLQARSAEDQQPSYPDGFTGSVDVRALAVPTNRHEVRATPDARPADGDQADSGADSGRKGRKARKKTEQRPPVDSAVPPPGRSAATAAEAARARRSKLLARRRRTTVLLFLAFTLGTVAAALGGIAFLWAPGVPAILLSVYIAYLRRQERRRFMYIMDRRRAEVAAQRLRERRSHGRPGAAPSAEAPAGDPGDAEDDSAHPAAPGASALAADRRALVEQTDHAEWVDDQQRERRRGTAGQGDSWDPVPVPLPTYVTAPVAPRAGGDVDLGAPDTWSSARSSAAEPPARGAGARQRDGSTAAGSGSAGSAEAADQPRAGRDSGRESRAHRDDDASSTGSDDDMDDQDDQDDTSRRPGARRTQGAPPGQSRWGNLKGRGGASGARGRGRTPLFDQYADGDRPRAAGQ
ncbi:divisome protein SepX/GlpR [Streptomyces odontomachi]|uniref:divisome protein SepX/GlpR n=1 Tax=Streptomyces odontomachi TaxID=2944940 RepID=UPI00210983E6|nr:gephyrin-like molybdotransferase receptor GlpR [Streptomyces sp. ODS25]